MKARLATVIGYKAIDDADSFASRDKEVKECEHFHFFDAQSKPKQDEIYDGGSYTCDRCGKKFVPNTGTQVYDTPSGDLEPGCLFWNYDYDENYFWDNHKGPHLFAVLPNGHHWNIDGRASNCGSPNDRLHRCWVRTGKPPMVHVSKDGHTCEAGAGSIWSNQGAPDQWHGYLHHGEFHT